MIDYIDNNIALKRTRAAFIWMKILDTPFWTIFNIFQFILFKNMHATALQITVVIILKPAVSLLSIYWSALIEKRKDRLLSNLISARIISHIPFLFFPFIDNVWFFIASFGLFMMLARGSVPAWMEVLKLNMPKSIREKVFAYASAFAFFGGAIFSIALGTLMDKNENAWRWIFFAATLLSMGAIFFKWRIPIEIDPSQEKQSQRKEIVKITVPFIYNHLKKPWKSAWELIARRPDFLHYQIGFLLGGTGLIIIQPALPMLMMDQLGITYTELALALTLFKGIGYALASPFWTRLLARIDIFRFGFWVSLLAAAFPLFLIASKTHLWFLFVAYLLNGCMQGGSEMSWNLSGPIFSKSEDSSIYSSVNVLAVGLRGCIIPAIGSLLMTAMNLTAILCVGCLCCLLSALYFKMISDNQVLDVKEAEIA